MTTPSKYTDALRERAQRRARHRVWLTLPEVLAELGVDRGTFDRWRRRGVGPGMK